MALRLLPRLTLTARRRRPLIALTIAALVATTTVGLVSAPVSAAGSCIKWASTGGDDGNAGSQAAPYRSLAKLVASLSAGQTGCLPAGQTYYAIEGNGIIGNGSGTSSNPVTITSAPGAPAIVKGGLWLQGSSHDVVLTDLIFAGSYLPDGSPFSTKGVHIIIHGDRISLTDNDISDGRGICVGVGKGHGSSTEGNVLAEDVLITRNVVHGCGMDANIVWSSGDSGAHGIYLEHSHDAVVTHNLVYGNRYRGLQLWPRNDGAEIAFNTFDENATHVNIGSSSACGGSCANAAIGFESVDTDVHDNIFSNRVTSWAPSQNPSQVYGYFLASSTPDQYGNEVHHNCFAPGDPAATGYGFQAYDNTTAAVTYANRAARDYHLTPGSACLGLGPSWLQPGDTTATVSIADASIVEGTSDMLGEMYFTLTRTGDLSRTVTGNVGWEDITATTNVDYNYLPAGGPLFSPGEATATLIFEVLRDSIPEDDETFLVHLSGLTGATLGDGTATGTIVDDDDDGVATYQPDAQARATRSGPWVGNDVYSHGANQLLRISVPRGRSRTVWVRVQNDGTHPDAWAFAEAGPGGKGLSRRWLLGSQNVTEAIDGGMLSFHDVAPGSSRTVKLVVTARKRATVGSVALWQLHGVHSPATDGIRDVVQIRAKVTRR